MLGKWVGRTSLHYQIHVKWHLGRLTSDLAHQPGNQKPRKPCQHPADQISGLRIVHMEVLRASYLVQYMEIIGYNSLIAQCFDSLYLETRAFVVASSSANTAGSAQGFAVGEPAFASRKRSSSDVIQRVI